VLCPSHGCIFLPRALVDHVEALPFMDFPDAALTNFYVLVNISDLPYDLEAGSPGV
jgi:hypothetical protein